MLPYFTWKIAEHCKFLRFLVSQHVFNHFLVAVVNGDSEKRKKVSIETNSANHDKTLDNIFEVSPWVNIREAESSH
jgi:hypothetical protein